MRPLYLIGTIFILLTFAHEVSAQKVFKISAIEKSPYTEIFKKVMSEVYRELGIVIEIQELPAERSKRVALLGRSDAELHRVSGLEVSKKLTIVPTPIMTAKIVAIGLKSVGTFSKKEDLSLFKLGARRGMRFIDKLLNEHQFQLVNTDRQLFNMVTKGRVDLAILPFFSAIELQEDYKDMNLKLLGPVLGTVDVYHYVNVKHKKLVPELDRIIKKYKSSGRVQKIIDEVAAKISNGEIHFAD